MAVSRRTAILAGAAGVAASSPSGAAATAPPPHVVLLGDSIFDNKAYVGAGPSVLDQMHAALGDGGTASLLAVDGSVVDDLPRQLARLPGGATHLVLSAGGNDALRAEPLLFQNAGTVAEALLALEAVQAEFAMRYRVMLDRVLDRGLPLAVCTIYDPNFEDDEQQKVSRAALALFNDVITRAAFARGLPVVDLRVIFDRRSYYANPIEPGPEGGARLVAAILECIGTHDFARARASVFGTPS
jgi:hypothetical protein